MIKDRTDYIKNTLYRIIDQDLVLIDTPNHINSLVGIKISLHSQKDTITSQFTAFESIYKKLKCKKFHISELDCIRFHKLLPLGLRILTRRSDSGQLSMQFDSALDVFNADLIYLRGPELGSFLGAGALEARARWERGVQSTALHPRFGRGSKVGLWQYRRLVEITAPGWERQLELMGAYKPQDSANDLRELVT